MYENSIICKTGQSWKCAAAFAMVLVGVLLMFGGVLALVDDQQVSSFAVVLAGMALAILGTLMAWTMVRCPKCAMRWFWVAMKTRPAGDWLMWLARQERCPGCGHTGTKRAA